MVTLRHGLTRGVALALLTAATVACARSGGISTSPAPGTDRDATTRTFGNKLPFSTPMVELSYTPDASIKRLQPPRAGAPATDFILLDLKGEGVSLSDLRGRAVMISFWATWCGPCRIELPHIVEVYEEYRDQGFEVLAVNVREDPNRVRKYVEEAGLSFTVLLDTRGQVSKQYFVRGIPTNVFVDRKGIVRAVHIGAMTERQLRDYVLGLIPAD